MMRKVLILVALLFASCGNNADNTDTAVSTPSSSPQGGVRQCQNRLVPTPAPQLTNTQSKPKIEIPDGAPPCKLVIQDIRTGSGAAAKAGANVTVQYVGVAWSTHQEFDSSWDRGQPATFSLGQVVQGWQQGIPGMKVGGRRQLTIPPELGYGAAGGPGIAGGETLVFIVDLVSAT
jgi:peptidylprolyl isomerase